MISGSEAPDVTLAARAPDHSVNVQATRERLSSFCRSELERMHKRQALHRVCYYSLSSAAILAAAAASALAFFSETEKSWIGLLALISATLSSMNATFSFRDNWVRLTKAVQALKLLSNRFEVSLALAASPEDAEGTLRQFADDIGRITMEEVFEWSSRTTDVASKRSLGRSRDLADPLN